MCKYIAENELSGEKRGALLSCVNANATDGLGISSTSLEQIGGRNFDEVDEVLKEYLKTGHISNQKVIDRHLRSEFKRRNPTNLERDIYFGNVNEMKKFSEL